MYVVLGEPESHLWPEQHSGAETTSPLRTGESASERELVKELGNVILSPEPITQNYIALNSFALYNLNYNVMAHNLPESSLGHVYIVTWISFWENSAL